jgi:anti-anti-sigma regulatory factor
MAIRITTSSGEEMATIRVEGRLNAEGVPDLERELQAAGAPVRLDLSGLMSADAAGVRELRALSASGVELCGASPYIRQMLEATSS